MRLTKFGHACVRIAHGGTTIVIDPGLFTDADAVQGADAVLITHEHFDHFAEDRVRAAVAANPGLRIWTNRAVAAQLDGIGAVVSAVGEGDAFEINGLQVTVHGEWHAELHRDIPQVGNIGFLLDGRLFHPGDAFTVPPQPVQTLLLPTSGPWTKLAEQIDYVREVAPRQAVSVHDAVHSDIGQAVTARWFGPEGPDLGGAEYVRLADGHLLDLG